MSKEIKISFIWDKDTFLKASKLAYEYELKKSNRKYLGWFFIALTQFGVVAAMKKGAIGLLFISTILVLYWYFLRWPLRKRFIKKTFDKLPNANEKYELKLDENSLTIDEKVIPWNDIVQVLVLDGGIFIYLNENSIYIPDSAFENIENKNDFLQILKSKVKNYTRDI